jgi:hypothetical protein
MEEKMAEVDLDMAEKHHVTKERLDEEAAETPATSSRNAPADGKKVSAKEGSSDDDDFGDDVSSSGDEAVFGSGAKTIVAEG